MNHGFLQGLVPKFNSIVDCHLKKLQPLANGKTSTPLAFYIQQFVLSIVSECFFGTSLSAMCANAARHITVPARFASGRFREPLMYILWRVNEGLMTSISSAAPTLMRFYSPVETKEYQDAISAVRKLGRDQIEARIKAIESGQETPTDLLNQILQLASLNGFGMEELVDNFYSFLGAGFDTTLNTIQFSIILLTQHPNIMIRVVEEVGEVLGDRTQVTVEDLKKLTYMEQVLYETLRLYTIISGGIPKSLHCDVNVDEDLTIPAKTTCMLISSVISSKAKYFEDPEVFNPDRFVPATSPDGFTFFPFGIGHRACIGKHFALMEAKMFLARFFQTFTVSLPDDYTLMPELEGLTLKPQGDLDCTLAPVPRN
ncbi:cholesterol 24-hydroxylase-like [Halichondria panicea]|uniref:cholesterol 24-hydroxylase-like n=1 Tax=Halichondria panicea TaxID=6063 RepID=UPI00312B5E79